MEETPMNYPDVFTTSESTTKIVEALLKFNDAMGTIAKDANNPFFKSAYADLPSILKAIKEPMAKNGLTINHFPVGDNRLVTRLSHKSGEFYQGVFFMKSVKDTPQDRGSVITYMMRYAVGAYLGLSIDKDDDGNKGTGNTVKPPVQPTLKSMTAVVKDTMLQFIADGKIDSVEKQLPKYNDSANKTLVKKAVADAKSVNDLEETQNPKK